MREVSHPVLSMALAGPHLCCAHPSIYTVYNLHTGTQVRPNHRKLEILNPMLQVELFPVECGESSPPPPILPTGPDEFLLLGPGGAPATCHMPPATCHPSPFNCQP